MKNLKTFENFINEELHNLSLWRSDDDPSASIGGIKPSKWDDVNLTDEEKSFLVFIYNNFASGGPVADAINWKYIAFEHGKDMMQSVIDDEYKELRYEKVAPIAKRILNKLNGE